MRPRKLFHSINFKTVLSSSILEINFKSQVWSKSLSQLYFLFDLICVTTQLFEIFDATVAVFFKKWTFQSVFITQQCLSQNQKQKYILNCCKSVMILYDSFRLSSFKNLTWKQVVHRENWNYYKLLQRNKKNKFCSYRICLFQGSRNTGIRLDFKCSSYSLIILFVCVSETETLLVLDRERSLDYTFLKVYCFIWYSFFNVWTFRKAVELTDMLLIFWNSSTAQLYDIVFLRF